MAPALAIALAEAALLAGVATEVVALLTGTPSRTQSQLGSTRDTVGEPTSAGHYRKESAWDGENKLKGDVSTDPTERSTAAGCDIELSRLIEKVRKHRSSRALSAKPKSS
ncbi:MAG: hypothetical protein IV100_26485 [Myxococcales bacterium]|nr:hypothetical protein [Myxococcales bacterium]